MEKTKNRALCLLLLFGLCNLSLANPVRYCALSCARDEVGVKERTGNNDGERVERYLQAVGLAKGNPWCAASMAFVYNSCRIPNPMSGYCPDWFRAPYLVYQRNLHSLDDFNTAKPGDVFGIWFNSKNRIAHMGMIEEVNGGYVTTLEGNTNEAGSRDGDGFMRKYRLVDQVYAVANYADH